MHIILDNLLSRQDTDGIFQFVTSPIFTWSITQDWGSVDTDYTKHNSDSNTVESMTLVCQLRTDASIVSTLLKKLQELGIIELKKVHRAKVNLQPRSGDYPEYAYSTPHIDADYPHHVLIFYLNDADGDTYLFDKRDDITKNYKVCTRITPKAGSCVVFEGTTIHAVAHPRNTKARVIVNIVFTGKVNYGLQNN